MKSIIYATLLSTMLLFTVGCTDAVVAAAIDEIKEKFDDEEETSLDASLDTLSLVKTSNGFNLQWDKQGSEYNEVIYRDDNLFREAIMEGSTAIIRNYTCTESENTENIVAYSCIGLGTPTHGDTSDNAEILIELRKDIPYAFFIDGENIHYILTYSQETLSINGQ